MIAANPTTESTRLSHEASQATLTIQRSVEAPAYSICTVFTRPAEYTGMRQSFLQHGFTAEDTEYLVADNSSGNVMDAFAAYNAFLLQARAPHIILCHQDILLLDDGRAKLDRLLSELQQRDPNWGLCGNAGVRDDGVLALRITDPHRADGNMGGPFPVQVSTLDENFIVVRRAANLALSRDLHGFHMHGADLCLVADVLGWSAWVIDFHLHHTSPGKVDSSYHHAKFQLRDKYQRAFRARWIKTPMLHPVFLSGQAALIAAARILHRLGFWPRLRPAAAVQRNVSGPKKTRTQI